MNRMDYYFLRNKKKDLINKDKQGCGNGHIHMGLKGPALQTRKIILIENNNS